MSVWNGSLFSITRSDDSFTVELHLANGSASHFVIRFDRVTMGYVACVVSHLNSARAFFF
jgi:hypothetical protein